MPMYRNEGFTKDEYEAGLKPSSTTAPAAVITALSPPPKADKSSSVPIPPQKEPNVKPCRL